MSEPEVAVFDQNPYRDEIVQLRHLDDAGKRTDMETPSFEYYKPLLQRLVDQHCGVAG